MRLEEKMNKRQTQIIDKRENFEFLYNELKDLEEFIPFGPFIVISSFIVMFVPFNILLNIPFYIFTLGRIK